MFFVPVNIKSRFSGSMDFVADFGYLNFSDAFNTHACMDCIDCPCTLYTPILYRYLIEGVIVFIVSIVICIIIFKFIDKSRKI